MELSHSPSRPSRGRHDRDDNRHGSRRSGYRPSLVPSSPPISRRANGPLPSQIDAFTKPASPSQTDSKKPLEKQVPNYATSGLLAAETNLVAGTTTVLKYNEPPEARLPSASTAPWRLFIFKGNQPDPIETIELYKRSCWLFGRDRAVVDVPAEHPSCSKQHAVIQFRYTEKWKAGGEEFGEKRKVGAVRPYVIDLESSNGTRVNGEEVPKAKFMELKTGDVIKLGESLREYVMILPPR